MSFNTGGHVVYITEPKKTSRPHALTESNGALIVFGTVPADGEDDGTSQQVGGTIFPERGVIGRIVG